MNQRHTSTELVPQEIVHKLLRRDVPDASRYQARPAQARRVATLERRAPEMVARAHRVGTDIEYVGVSPLFAEPRLYEGVATDWVLGPATRLSDAIVPRGERQALQRLSEAGIDFPLIYVAHEVTKQDSEHFRPVVPGGHTVLARQTASDLIGPVPPPAAAVEVAGRLDQHSARVVTAIGRALPIAAAVAVGIVAAPAVLVGGAPAGLAATLDPIILGAIPALTNEPEAPAAWYILARWDW